MNTKVCSKCKLEKFFSEFNRLKNGKYGLNSECKICRNNYLKEYYENNKEKIHKRQKEYYWKRRPERIDIDREYRKQYRNSYRGKLLRRYDTYKENARRSNKIFQIDKISFEQITSKSCMYCGKFSENKDYVGIDRIDSSLGYVKDNIVPCCDRCNFMKQEYTTDSFINKIKDIVINLKLGTINES